jgi:segregation and condensation protein B
VSTSHELLAQLEAVLMVVDEPVTVTELATALELDESDVAEGLQELVKDYRGETGSRTRGFVLRETGSGWRIYSAPEHDQIVGKFVTAGRMAP